MGSWGCSSSAKIAVSSITSISAPPAAPSGFLRAKRARTVQAPARGRAPTGTAIAAGLTAIAHARVEDAVQHVDEQVGEDHDDGDEHHEVLDDGIIAPENRLDQEPGDAGQVEDRLGDHQTADEERELDAADGDHGQQRVLERVKPDVDAPCLPLGPARPVEGLASHLVM